MTRLEFEKKITSLHKHKIDDIYLKNVTICSDTFLTI
jgi:hypothetical protein